MENYSYIIICEKRNLTLKNILILFLELSQQHLLKCRVKCLQTVFKLIVNFFHSADFIIFSLTIKLSFFQIFESDYPIFI